MSWKLLNKTNIVWLNIQTEYWVPYTTVDIFKIPYLVLIDTTMSYKIQYTRAVKPTTFHGKGLMGFEGPEWASELFTAEKPQKYFLIIIDFIEIFF